MVPVHPFFILTQPGLFCAPDGCQTHRVSAVRNDTSEDRAAGDVPVAVSLGSNLGDRLAYLRQGVMGLTALLRDLRLSSVYETAPRHVTDQPPFLNACAVGRTRESPEALLRALQAIERSAGRVLGGERFGPRTLDLDLLLFGQRVVRAPGLRVPHPRLAERAFVLIPLAEVAPDWRHPELDRTVEELAREISGQGVERHAVSIQV